MDYYRSTATRNLMQAVAGEPDGIPILDVNTPEGRDYLFKFVGAGFGHDPAQYVPDMMAAPLNMKTYARSEWDGLYDAGEQKQDTLEHLYLADGWENLDQDGQGFCWCYSSGHAVMLRRMAMHLPHVRLNPHAVASLIKGGRDEGGWCGLSLPKYRDGCPEEGDGPLQWPKQKYGTTLNKRWDNPDFKAAAARVRVTDDWYDLGKPAYSQMLKDEQLATCLFNNQPSPVDYDEWSHSICAVRWVRVSTGNWAPLILNSWKGWGRRGLAVIQSSWHHDGAVSVVSSAVA